MKRVIFPAILLASCASSSKPSPSQKDSETFYKNTYVVELAVRDEFHEYIVYDSPEGAAMCHLPNCIYCFAYETQNE